MGDSKKIGELGFRDLESFNKVMLAKQYWRIFNNPSSLVARVMKEKYFKEGRLMEAKLGYGPSLIWRSLWHSIGLIKEGLLWRVGNESQIKIWKDRWLPSSSTHMVQSPAKILPEDSCVQQLIDVSTSTWKTNLIEDIFLNDEADAIYSIPLSRLGAEDKVMWGYTNKGVFFVKSAYHLEHSRIRVGKGETSTVATTKVGWNPIWKLNVQGVVKQFIWKACHDLIPTRLNLFKKHICDTNLCSICEKEVETITYNLWYCPADLDVWAEHGSPVHKWANTEVEFMELWKKLNLCLEEEEVGLVAYTMRQIWL